MDSKIIESLRTDLYDLVEEIEAEKECFDCRKGPCIVRLYKGVGFIHSGSIYVVGGDFYIKRCSPLMKKAKGSYNVMVHRADSRRLFIPPDIVIAAKEKPEPGGVKVDIAEWREI